MHIQNAVSNACYRLLNSLSANEALASFALAGGTSLALRIGHRISIDLDFFTEHPFESTQLLQALTPGLVDYVVLTLEKNTLNLMIENVKVQFLGHEYPILKPFEAIEGVRHYSFEDITAMKMNAIANRGDKKDFWDFSYLLEKFTAIQALDFFKAKYRQFDTAHVVKSLSYFQDAELQPDPVQLKKTNWQAVKEKVLRAEREIVTHYI